MLCALTACASSPVVKTQTVTVKVPVIEPVPLELTAQVPRPVLSGNTNGALADAYLAALRALDEANAKLREIAGLFTQPVAEPRLKDGPVTNDDLADWALALRQALRQANAKPHEIAGLHP